MNKFNRKVITLFMTIPCILLSGCGEEEEKVESKVLDQHVLFAGYKHENRVLSFKIKSSYDIFSIKYEYTLFDTDKKLVGVFNETQDVSISKNKEYVLNCLEEVTADVDIVRFKVLEAKTYDKVDNNKVIEGKVYYYDYLSIFSQDFILQSSEKVQPKSRPTAYPVAKDFGAFKFSYWSYDFYGEDKFDKFNEIARGNLMLYPNFIYFEDAYNTILQDDTCYNAQFVINRTFKDIETGEEKVDVGYGTVYKISYNRQLFGITTLSFLEKTIEGYEFVEESLHMKKDDYSYVIHKKYPEYNLAIIEFDLTNSNTSTKHYFEATLAATSFIHAKTNKIGIIEPPYNLTKKDSVSIHGQYIGHETIGEKDYLKYECAIGENMEGCAIYDCQGNIVGINTSRYENGVGYAIPVESVRLASQIS